MSQKFLLAVDTKDTPGKLKLTIVSFDYEYIDASNADDLAKKFNLLDNSHPHVRRMLELFK